MIPRGDVIHRALARWLMQFGNRGPCRAWREVRALAPRVREEMFLELVRRGGLVQVGGTWEPASTSEVSE